MSLLQPVLHWGSNMNFLRERFILETVKDTLFKQQQQQHWWPASAMHVCGELIIFWDPRTSYPPNNNNNSPSHPFPWKADGWGVLGCENDFSWQESRAVRRFVWWESCAVGGPCPLWKPVELWANDVTGNWWLSLPCLVWATCLYGWPLWAGDRRQRWRWFTCTAPYVGGPLTDVELVHGGRARLWKSFPFLNLAWTWADVKKTFVGLLRPCNQPSLLAKPIEVCQTHWIRMIDLVM